MDKGRILDLKAEHDKLSLAGAILLLTFAQSGPDLCSVQEFKTKLKDDTMTLLKSAETQRQVNLKTLLEEISEKLKHDVLTAVERYGVGENQINVENLTAKLTELTDKENKIRHLLSKVQVSIELSSKYLVAVNLELYDCRSENPRVFAGHDCVADGRTHENSTRIFKLARGSDATRRKFSPIDFAQSRRLRGTLRENRRGMFKLIK